MTLWVITTAPIIGIFELSKFETTMFKCMYNRTRNKFVSVECDSVNDVSISKHVTGFMIDCALIAADELIALY